MINLNMNLIWLLNEITKSQIQIIRIQQKNPSELRHSLWLLPGVAEAKALKTLWINTPFLVMNIKLIL